MRTLTSCASDAADGLAHLLHDRAAADDAIFALFLRQHGRRLHQPGRIEGAAQQSAEALEIERLDEVIEGAAFHRLDGGVGGAVRSDEDNGTFRIVFVQFAE